MLKVKYEALLSGTFWISIKEEDLSVIKLSLSISIYFPFSYLCELGFSYLTNMPKKKILLCPEEKMDFSYVHLNTENVIKKYKACVSN